MSVPRSWGFVRQQLVVAFGQQFDELLERQQQWQRQQQQRQQQ
jgi:hypothetical protein